MLRSEHDGTGVRISRNVVIPERVSSERHPAARAAGAAGAKVGERHDGHRQEQPPLYDGHDVDDYAREMSFRLNAACPALVPSSRDRSPSRVNATRARRLEPT